MRFITEFELSKEDSQHPERDYFIERKKEYRGEELFDMIEDAFGWQNPVNNNPDHHRLEIEAFPMDKWIEFRKRFLAALPDYDNTSRIRLENALHDLESFGKPSGDTITNPK